MEGKDVQGIRVGFFNSVCVALHSRLGFPLGPSREPYRGHILLLFGLTPRLVDICVSIYIYIYRF